MLVRHHLQGWKIISHYTHAFLAGKIGSHLQDSLRKTHWPETLTAIINHDDQMLDFESTNYLTDAGTPRDFTMEGGDKKDSLKHVKYLYSETIQKSQWISLLVSRHLEFLNKDSPDKEMQQFISEMYERRKEQRKLYSINLDDEDHLYSIIRFCDRLSLILCGEEVPQTGRALEINTSINNETYYISRTIDSTFEISPWVFQKEKFELDYEYRILEQATFNSNNELKKSIINAPIKLRTLILGK